MFLCRQLEIVNTLNCDIVKGGNFFCQGIEVYHHCNVEVYVATLLGQVLSTGKERAIDTKTGGPCDRAIYSESLMRLCVPDALLLKEGNTSFGGMYVGCMAR